MPVGRQFQKGRCSPIEWECDRKWADWEKSGKTCFNSEKNKNIDENMDALSFHYVYVNDDDSKGIEDLWPLPWAYKEINIIDI